MSALKAYPKISHLGTKYVSSIFDEEVEITEKIDGSQFVFGRVGGGVLMRSKGAEIQAGAEPKMFRRAVEVIQSMCLPEDIIFYGEYLEKPKHNVLNYSRTPRSHIALFGMSDATRETMAGDYDRLAEWADKLGMGVAPLLYRGRSSTEHALSFMGRESALGGVNAEGIVVKNYKDCHIAERVYPVMAAKYVSEQFKEVHSGTWKGEHTGRGKWDAYKEGYKTEARWRKAVQHLRDDGRLTGEPKDIAALLKEVKNDIIIEESEAIKAFLWREFGDELLRRSVAGLPEWYKEQIALGKVGA